MANHKSAKKRIKQNEKRRVNTKWKVSRLRTAIKGINTLISEGNKDEALKAFPAVQSLFAKLAKSSAIRKDTASRKSGRIAAKIAKL